MSDVLPWLLAFDASAPRTVVAIGRVGAHDAPAAFDEDEDGANQTSARLVPRIRRIMEEAGVNMNDLSAVAVGCGPGTFTGSRVAVATAKGLCMGLGIPAVPVSTLASLAASANRSGRVLALLDARRSEVYGAIHRFEGEDIVEEQAPRCEPIANTLDGVGLADLFAFGPGVAPYRESFPKPLSERCLHAPGPTAAGLWRAATHAWHAQRAVGPSQPLRVVHGIWATRWAAAARARYPLTAPRRSSTTEDGITSGCT
jgi:tRNA threonylcarbamoyl adenosine modification protein YeaZ